MLFVLSDLQEQSGSFMIIFSISMYLASILPKKFMQEGTGYMWLHVATTCYMWLEHATCGYSYFKYFSGILASHLVEATIFTAVLRWVLLEALMWTYQLLNRIVINDTNKINIY